MVESFIIQNRSYELVDTIDGTVNLVIPFSTHAAGPETTYTVDDPDQESLVLQALERACTSWKASYPGVFEITSRYAAMRVIEELKKSSIIP